MARIRTIKPEAWESEDLAAVDVTAVVTFLGLLTHADDAGRHRDLPAIIAGRLWALRPNHTPAHVANDLEQLASRNLVCRYTGCDGKTWLHIVTWDRHQKINRPSASRLPRCPIHDAAKACGECGTRACPTQARSPYDQDPRPNPASMDLHGELSRPGSTDLSPVAENVTPATPATVGMTDAALPDTPPSREASEETPAQSDADPNSDVIGATFSEASGTGSRILDPGSSRRGRETPAPDSPPQDALEAADASEWSAKRLMAEYLRGCTSRPPKRVLGHLGREIRALLDEGFAPDALRPALERLRAKGLHPSVLPSLVNEALNATAPSPGSSPASASGAGPWAAASPAYAPYLNPSEPTGTFGVAL
ncbi:hypothetical protein ACWGI1_02370 [Streptomyces sp. NPDC054835]|uniref:hypothetical protein n=1 Tax=Streptomyces exfoliatus TaxID=1905 RepID=UPI00046502EC|nr:hypothetical protein [Streptomyces exfoliatus]